MSTPRLPNQKTQYKKLNERLSRYVASVLSIYESLNKEAAKIALSTDYDGTEEFSFDDYPITKDRVHKLQQQFVSDLGGVIMSGTSEEWKNSNLLQDMIADKVLGKYVGEHKGKEFEHYYQKNSGALKAFQQRKDKGLNLSQKLWNQSADYKTELEEILSVSIEKGIDAVTLSKRVSKYLWDFPSMQAAYEEKFGHASRAKNCEYRSIRLARSEINMAYRTAEQERWRQFDFVIGYEIKLSGSHPKRDVCDDLVGKYPKDFEFLGFHPNCLCYCVPILKTDDEYFADDDVKSPNEVTDVPKNFKEWATGNWNRIAAAEKRGTLPYFLRDNKEYYQKELSVKKAAVLRHKNRDAKAIQAAWDNRTYLRSYAFSEKSLYNYEDYIDVVKQGKYFGVSTKELEEYVLYAKDIKAEEYAKLIESANEKIREKHQTVAKYRSELYRIKRSLSEANGQYQMQDIQDKITEFIANNKLAGGPGSIKYGDEMPNASIFREFANKIKKEVVSRSEHLQIKTGISKNLPTVLYPKSKYLKGEDYLFDKEFFDLLPEEVKFVIKDGDGVSNYNAASKICTIYDGNRNAGSRYHAKSVIYHEGGHSIFDRRQLVKDKKFIQLFQYAESELLYMDEFSIYYPLLGGRAKRKMTRGSYISRRLEIIRDRVANASDSELKILQRHGFCREDILEAIGSCADLLKSVDNRIGWGHDTSYFTIGDNRQHEFIAHAFESKFIGNPFIKKFMPDIYSRMLAYVESL